MKTKTLRILAVVMMATLFVSAGYSQIVTTAGSLNACPGSTISVPVNVTDFNGVASISLKLNINTTVLTYTGYANANSQLASGMLIIGLSGNQVGIAWFSMTPATIASGKLLDLKFTYNGGSSTLHWDIENQGNCQYSNLMGDILPATFVDGTVGLAGQMPVVNLQPNSVSINDGQNASFTTDASYATNFQWEVSTDGGSSYNNVTDNTVYTGSATNTLNLTSVPYSMNGNKYRCHISETGCNNSINTSEADLTVNQVIVGIQTTCGSATACTGSQVILPVDVANFLDVASISLKLNVDPAVLTYTGYQNQNPALSTGMLIIGLSANQVGVAWFSMTPANIGSGKLLDLKFNYLGGNTTLHWDVETQGNCQYSNLGGDILLTSFIDGTVGPAAAAPEITTQPADAAIQELGNATFTVTATGVTNYQWQVSTNGGSTWSNLTAVAPYSGVNTETLTITGATLAMTGYKYHCVVSETICNQSLTSNSATLTVNPMGQEVIAALGNVAGCPGSNIHIPVNVTNFSNVTAYLLTIHYDASMSYVNFAYNPAAAGTFNVTPTPGTLVIQWDGPIGGTSIANGELLNLEFTYNGGSFPVIFDPTVATCWFDGLSGPMSNSFVDGSVSPAAQAPVVTSDPVDVTVYEGGNASFSITATGAVNFQWQVLDGGVWTNLSNDAIYSNVTTPTLNITGALLTMNGKQYRCQAIEGVCALPANSNAAVLNVNPAPNGIVTTAGSVTACPNQDIVVPVDVIGFTNVASVSLALNYDTLALSYTDFSNPHPDLSSGMLLVNKFQSQIRIAWFSTAPANFGTGLLLNLLFHYNGGNVALEWDTITAGNCQYSDMNGDVMAASFISGSVSPSGAGPVITQQPVNTSANIGDNASFVVNAAGVNAYEWLLSTDGGSTWTSLANTPPYAGVATNTLDITGVTAGMDGYQFKCALTGGACNTVVYTNAVVLHAYPAGVIICTAGSVTSCAGTVVVPVTVTSFNSIASISLKLAYDTVALTYNSYQNENPALSAGMLIVGTYQSKVGIAWFSVTPVTFGNGTLLDLVFTLNGGSSNLQWDVATPGQCQFSDLNGAILPSAFVNGSVTDPGPSLLAGPQDMTVYVGGTASFSVTVGGSAAYQWQVFSNSNWINLLNSSVYSGVATHTLVVSNATLAMNGYQYRCLISGTCPTITTAAVTLGVITQQTITTSIPVMNGCQGTILVPVNVTDFYGVSSLTLHITYNPSTLTYVGIQNVNTAFGASPMNVTQTFGAINLSWNSATPAVIGTGVMLDLAFTGNSGTSAINFNTSIPGYCQYTNLVGNVFPGGFTNGSVTINPLPGQPGSIVGASMLCLNPPNSTFTCAAAANAQSYLWEINPVSAGVLTPNGTTCVVDWSNTFTGQVTISVKGVNTCGTGSPSAKVVTINPVVGPAGTPTGPTTVCQNAANTNYVTTGAAYADTYVWYITPSNAGTLSGTGTTCTVDWNNSFSGNATITVAGQNYCGLGPVSNGIVVTVNPLPGTPGALAGPTSLCINPSNSTYTTSGATNTLSYEWTLSPSNAGVLTPGTPATTATVDWSNTFTGTATVSVHGVNNCGNGPDATATVLISPLPTVTFVIPAAYNHVCITHGPYSLIWGSPAGGTYSGPGVTNGIFTPSVAGVGTHTITYNYTSPQGCSNSATATIQVDICPGFEEFSGQTQVALMPNPSNGIFTLEIKGLQSASDIVIYNNLGGIVFSEKLENLNSSEYTRQLNLSVQPKGIYFLKLVSKTGATMKKIVIQ